MSYCCCSLAGTAACRSCSNNPYADFPPVVRTNTVVVTDKVLITDIKTNADRIRAMTDEELADFIGGIFTLETDVYGDYDPRTVVSQEPRVELRDREDALDWLKQEVDDV